MANVINATSTGNGGLITTGDDSGILNIQTNETTAVSVDASQNLTFTNAINTPNTFGFKNRIINGAMMIDQRNAGATITNGSGTTYNLDRWLVYDGSGGSHFSIAQNLNTVTPPAGFVNYLGIKTTSAVSAAAGNNFTLQQYIEGFNIADLAWGTASAKSVTISFWVYSSLTGQFGGSLRNDSSNYFYPFTYTISSANTWEQKTITIAGPTSGTWLTNNGRGIAVLFDLGLGSNFQGTAGAWTASSYYAPTGDTSVVGTLNATFYVTGVQLEKGTQATSFDFRSYGTELALCQRYLPAFNYNDGGDRFRGAAASTTVSNCVLPFQVRPRVPPTGISVSSASHWSIYSSVNGISGAATAITFGVAGAYTGEVNVTTTAGSPTLAQGNTDVLYPANSSAQILFTGCEL